MKGLSFCNRKNIGFAAEVETPRSTIHGTLGKTSNISKLQFPPMYMGINIQ